MDVEFDSKGIKAKAGTLAITIYSSQATKFASGTDQAKYEHLNINFEGGIPTDAEGIFAELSGVKAMSEATAALLKHPEGIPAAGALFQKASGCVCTFNVNLTAPVKTYYATNALECNAETVGSQICGSQFDRPVAGDFSIAFKFRQTPAQSAAQPIEANDGSQPQDQTEIVQGTAWYYGGGLVDCEMPGAQNDFGISTGNGHVFFGIGSVDGPAHTIGSGGGYDDGEWHEVIATREQSSGNSALYIDDLLVGTKTDGTKNDLDSATSMRIGKLQTNINPFYGEIKSVAIYNYVVSQFPP